MSDWSPTLVTVPSVDAETLHATIEQLATCAKQEHLTPPETEALDRAVAANTKLAGVLSLRLFMASQSGKETLAANWLQDRLWKAWFSWLRGWADAPGLAQAPTAQMILDRIHPTGLQFTNAKSVVQWTETELRLEQLAEPELAAAVDTLGGKPFVDALRDSQLRLATSLGIGVAQTQQVADLRGAIKLVRAALKLYAIRVLATVDFERPDTQARADRLLAPLAALGAKRPRTKSTEPEPAEPNDIDG